MTSRYSEPLSVAVIRAIAETEKVKVADLEVQLNEAVDPEAVNLLGQHHNGEWRLQFVVEGHEVIITGQEGIWIDGEQVSQ